MRSTEGGEFLMAARFHLQFDSALESRAAQSLLPHGIVRSPTLLPVALLDANGAPFKARADFCHEATGTRFEVKDSHLNGTTTQAAAANADRRWRGPNGTYRQTRTGWNHSATKLATVQRAMSAAGSALVPVFMSEPDAETADRLRRHGTFWLRYDSQAWTNFLCFLKLRTLGLSVSLTYGLNGEPAHRFS